MYLVQGLASVGLRVCPQADTRCAAIQPPFPLRPANELPSLRTLALVAGVYNDDAGPADSASVGLRCVGVNVDDDIVWRSASQASVVSSVRACLAQR